MGFENRYFNYKKKLLNDNSICKENRELFKKFFEYEEYKLKRINNLHKLDENTFKTLYTYLIKFKNINGWFKNKAWINLTEKDIKEVYDKLEDNKILSQRGKPLEDKQAYYSKVFRSKPFEMAGKKQMAKKVMEFYRRNNNEEVRFIDEAAFKEIVSNVITPIQKLLCWLAWDIGENINTLLELDKKDFVKQKNPDTNEIEYRINLPKGKLKRTRLTRSEITNFKETAELLNKNSETLKDNEKIFKFGYRQAKKFFDRSVRIAKAKTIPKGQPATWKDLRSGMACYLLRQGWTTDEINSRLGHKPSSRELDKYVNFLAIDRHKPKKKLYENDLKKVVEELEEVKQINKSYSQKFKNYEESIKQLKQTLKKIQKRL